MPVHELAGKPAPPSLRANIARLVTAYFNRVPDPERPEERVAFGTSGHRGSALRCGFNEAHILSLTQAICEWRSAEGITGPLFLGMDTHALSEPAHASTLEVLAGNGVAVRIQEGLGYTPSPAVSHAVLSYNRGKSSGLADGIVVTPSHNPPEDGGFKYNPPSGGPAEPAVTQALEKRANELLRAGLSGVRRIPYEKALRADSTRTHDYVSAFVGELEAVIDLAAIREAGVKIGADPLGGSTLAFWEAIGERHRLNLEVVNPAVDPTFGFMSVDKDGKIRMDCSSPYAMARLIGMKDDYAVAFGNDPDGDRHGIVTPGGGLMNPNAYLAVAVDYLFRNRPRWRPDAGVGKTLVSSSLIDRIAARLGRKLVEVPVGFKWFVEGLADGSLGFGGEESAGAAFLRMDGTPWSTDKDGIIMSLLAAEITARTGTDPAGHYRRLAEELGEPLYERLDAPASGARKEALKKPSPDRVRARTLAGEEIIAVLSNAPGNGASIGGLKVVAENGWFAARPSGTEDVYKIYAESFKGREHLQRIHAEATELVEAAFQSAGV